MITCKQTRIRYFAHCYFRYLTLSLRIDEGMQYILKEPSPNVFPIAD